MKTYRPFGPCRFIGGCNRDLTVAAITSRRFAPVYPVVIPTRRNTDLTTSTTQISNLRYMAGLPSLLRCPRFGLGIRLGLLNMICFFLWSAGVFQ
jgi:hypothetical protein